MVWSHKTQKWYSKERAAKLNTKEGTKEKKLRTGLLALLLGTRFATRGSWHRYERSDRTLLTKGHRRHNNTTPDTPRVGCRHRHQTPCHGPPVHTNSHPCSDATEPLGTDATNVRLSKENPKTANDVCTWLRTPVLQRP